MSAEAKSEDHFPLDDAAIEFLTPRRQQIRALNTEINAVLTYFLRQHKLEGQWMLAENDRELVKRTRREEDSKKETEVEEDRSQNRAKARNEHQLDSSGF